MLNDEPLTTEAVQKAIDRFKQMFGLNEPRPQEFAQGGIFTVAPQPLGIRSNCVNTSFRSQGVSIRYYAQPIAQSWTEVEEVSSTPEQAYEIGRDALISPSQDLEEDVNAFKELQRLRRFNQLRGSNRNPLHTLGEINRILEQEGFSEVQGANFTPKARK